MLILELLTRFELVTHFPQKALLRGPTVYHGAAPQTPAAYAAKDEAIKNKHHALLKHSAYSGAANQIRTGDLVLTKDVLCLLSHSSIRKRQDELAFCGDPERARTVDL